MADDKLETFFTYKLHVLKKLTDRAMNDAFSAAVSISVTEARLLLCVGAFGPLSISELGRVSNLDRSQASRGTDSLGRKGLLEKTANSRDGRGVIVALSGEGRKRFQAAMAVSRETNRELLSRLSEAERHTLDDLLDKLIAGYEP